jgi:hypothetical protein
MQEKCAICGARISKKSFGFKNVCDSICNRAKKNKVTRQQQYFLDDKKDMILENAGQEPWFHPVITDKEREGIIEL